MFASPAVAGDLLYIGSCSGLIYALDKSSGDTVWTYDTGGKSFHGDPIFKDSLIVIPSDDRWFEGSVGPVYCLNRYTGDSVWQFNITDVTELGVGVTTDLIDADGALYGVTTTERLVRLNHRTGELIWEHQSGFDPKTNYWNSCPDYSPNGHLFFGTMDGHLKALDIWRNEVIFARDIGSRITTSVEYHNGSVYFGAENQHIYRLTANGSRLDSLYLLTPNAMQMATYEDRVFVFTSDDLTTGGMEYLYALDTALADTVWSISAYEGSAWSIKRPYFNHDRLLLGDGLGGVFFLDPRNGNILASFQLDGEIRSAGFDGDVAYIGTISGMVHAVRMKF